MRHLEYKYNQIGYYECDDYSSSYCDLDGKPNERTPITHRYSYDPYVLWKEDYNKGDFAVYSDRLYQYNHQKYNKAIEEVYGDHRQIFYKPDPPKIEKVLQLINEDDTIKLTAIMEGANQSSGHPYWIFFYRTALHYFEEKNEDNPIEEKKNNRKKEFINNI